MKSLVLVSLSIYLSSHLSFAGGSRVGNGGGKNSSSIRMEGFGIESELPTTFKPQSQSSRQIILEGLPVVRIQNGLPITKQQRIEILDLKTEFPELSGLSRAELKDWFQNRNWSHSNTYHRSCPMIQVGQNKNLVTIVVAWNSSNGIAMIVDNTTDARAAAQTILTTMKPIDKDKEGCQWK